MMELKIEKGVPLPPHKRHYGLATVCRNMEQGDSLFLPDRSHSTVYQLLGRLKKKGFRYTVRKVEGGVRIWCIEPVQQD